MRIGSGLLAVILIGLSATAHAQSLDVKKMLAPQGQAAPSDPKPPAAEAPAPAAPVAPSSTAAPSVPSPPYAETLPVEVSLMYSKLLKDTPNFDFLVFANPDFRKNIERYSDASAVKKEKAALEAIYNGFNEQTLFYSEKTVQMNLSDADIEVIKIRGIEPFEPIIYEMTSTDKYGLFIRNASSTLRLSPPFEVLEASRILDMPDDALAEVVAEMTIKPLVADREDFEIESDPLMRRSKKVKVLVGDIVELKLFDKDKEHLLLQKRFKNWKPYVPPKEDEAFRADGLIPAPTP